MYLRQYKPHTMPNVSLVLADLDLGEIPVLACSWLADQGARVTQGDRLLEVVAGEETMRDVVVRIVNDM